MASYSFFEFLDKLKNGGFTIDLCGHDVRWCDDIRRVLIEKIEFVIGFLSDSGESTPDEAKAKMSTLSMLSHAGCITEGQRIIDLPFDVYCSRCGEHFFPFLSENDVIKFGKYRDDSPRSSDFSLIAPPCPVAEGTKQHTVRIDVPTGNLLFANHFGKGVFRDAPAKKQYTPQFSLGSKLGVINIMGHLASQNVGYQQLGNTSVNVFQHKTSDEILVALPYFDDGDDYLEELKFMIDKEPEHEHQEKWRAELAAVEETLKRLERFDHRGSITLTVWRWMCVDESFLEGTAFAKDEYLEYIHLRVAPGVYELTYNDYVGDGEDDNPHILTSMKRIGAIEEAS